MTDAAPRISPRLLAAVERLDDGDRAIAEVCRDVGDTALRLGLSRPSYEQVRVLVHASRRRRAARPSTAAVLLDVATRAKPVDAVLDHLAGTS